MKIYCKPSGNNVPFYIFQFENHLNKGKLVQRVIHIFLALKLARYKPIIHMLRDSIQFDLLIINVILFTLCSVFIVPFRVHR